MVVIVFLSLMAVIIFAAYLLSRGAEVLAEKWGSNIVGSILLALVTTLPEYAFVYWASMKDQYQMAIGSAIGACTLLITLGYGLVIILATSRLSRKPVKEIKLSRATRIDALYLMLTGIVAFAFIAHDDALSLWEGIVLTIIFAGYVYQVFRGSKHHVAENLDIPRIIILKALRDLVLGGA